MFARLLTVVLGQSTTSRTDMDYKCFSIFCNANRLAEQNAAQTDLLGPFGSGHSTTTHPGISPLVVRVFKQTITYSQSQQTKELNSYSCFWPPGGCKFNTGSPLNSVLVSVSSFFEAFDGCWCSSVGYAANLGTEFAVRFQIHPTTGPWA